MPEKKKKHIKNITLFKQINKLGRNVTSSRKPYRFKRKKWRKFRKRLRRNSFYKRNLFRLNDLSKNVLQRFDIYHNKKFRYYLQTMKKLRIFYGGMSKKKLKEKFNVSPKIRNKGMMLQYFFSYFERRVDVSIYRAHFAGSVRSARQLVMHGKVLVNGKVVRRSSVLLNEGDVVSLHESVFKKGVLNLLRTKFWPLPPKSMQICYDTFTFIITETHKDNMTMYYPFWLDVNTLTRLGYLKF